MKDIIFEGSPTQFVGRSGLCKCSGISFYKRNPLSKKEVPFIEISPLNSKGLVGRCAIEIPVTYIEQFISDLQEIVGDDTNHE